MKLGESKEIQNQGSGMQNEQIALQASFPVTFFKFVILDGWDDFVTVHKIQIEWLKEKGKEEMQSLICMLINAIADKNLNEFKPNS